MLNDKMPLKMVFAAILFIAYKNEKKLESIENNSDLILIDY